MGRRIEAVMVMVKCLCQGKKKRANLDPEDRSGGRCDLCAGHPGQMEKWVDYDDLLDQIRTEVFEPRDLNSKVDPRSQV